MALRLYPFRQYNETDVINLYAYDAVGAPAGLSAPFTHGDNDNGVLVKVTNGNMSNDPVAYETNSYLGKTDYPNVGRDQYPVVPLKYQPATGGDECLGVTLHQTLTHDENGEKLLYYPQKALEMQAMLTGQAVPIATKGVFTFSQVAFDGVDAQGNSADGGRVLSPGTKVGVGSAGKLSGIAFAGADTLGGPAGTNGGLGRTVVGTILASGRRESDAGTTDRSDYFSITSSDGVTETGNYWVVKVDL